MGVPAREPRCLAEGGWLPACRAPGRAGAQEVRKESAQGGGALPGLFAVFCHF